ncbi:hypothetical protein A2Z33_05395 [Candidatus Gottesmanbacteria bacterium RBG_16_52_11]|uniref:Major facilitator superfamily (MFS) profile domain-containing protein n=1 Tax=Candidatus Gottesmanbacteria bacterium RBG_16_52_11 TaxID=1798374 RepID=A0A1F5YM96_9BACT|nr:MAG: hypothetical protein A2Z33_05395 [Candidatus Gottesmanbacteria bacterium RBG_16_52_11]
MKRRISPDIPRPVVFLGLVSFFNDIASEMIYPVLPIFLTQVLGTPVAIVGVIEGIAEATASISKLTFGYISDRVGRRKPFVTLGYGFGAVSKIMIALASGWPAVLLARFADRMGKGLRTAARDSMLLSSAPAGRRGFVFGFHRAFDSLGAVIGPLLGLALIQIYAGDMRKIFFWAVLPASVSVLVIIFTVPEARKFEIPGRRFAVDWSLLTKKLKLFLLVSFLFTLGNSSDVFLLLKAKSLGMTTTLVILAYVLYNVTQTVLATPAGSLSDRIGARKVYLWGLLVFAIVYFLFGFARSPAHLFLLFPVYGLYIAATDGVSKAFISQYVTENQSGTFFGLHQLLNAVAGFAASVIGGIIWTRISPAATFWYGSIMAMIAFMFFSLISPGKQPDNST